MTRFGIPLTHWLSQEPTKNEGMDNTTSPEENDPHPWASAAVKQLLLRALLGIASEYMRLAEWQAREVG